MKPIIRGGQTSLHSFHMSAQVIWVMLKLAFLAVVIGDLVYVFSKFDWWNLKEITIYYLALFCVALGSLTNGIFSNFGKFSFENFQFNFSGRFGDIHQVKAVAIIHNSQLIALKNSFFAAFWQGLLFGLLLALVAVIGLVYLFSFRGKKLSAKKFIRGGRLVSKRKLKKLIIRSNFLEAIKLRNLFVTSGLFDLSNPLYKSYNLAAIPFPKDAEFLHTIILGSTGTGKTNAILELIDQIRKNGDAAIIYDKMGAYTATYYDPACDIILNPLDARSKSWSLFNEVRRESDYDYLASAFIPEKKSGSDPFWIEAARRVFSTFAKEVKKENPAITNSEFVDAILRSNHKQIAQFLAGTEASSLISADSEKTSLSILAILSAYVSSIKYLHDEDKEKFSIRKWIESIGARDAEHNFSNSRFLFISSKGDQHESLKPLISTWLDIAVKSLLSLEQNQYACSKSLNGKSGQNQSNQPRRIWIILDEVGSLQSLPSLLDGLAQSRQFGGAFVISLHSISQLKAIYGKDTTDTITSLCRNKLFFSVPDSETADFCSQNLGFQEIEEVKEGISYGVSEIRDGVNLNTHKHLARLVIPSEFMFMRKLQAYLKFAGEFPIAKISFALKNRPKISQKFIERNQQKENSEDQLIETEPEEQDSQVVVIKSKENYDESVANPNFDNIFEEDKLNSGHHCFGNVDLPRGQDSSISGATEVADEEFEEKPNEEINDDEDEGSQIPDQNLDSKPPAKRRRSRIY